MPQQLAVLIDADNISSKMMERIMMLVSARGEPVIRRIYGDWSQNQLSGWKCMVLQHAFQPVQQYRYAVGKNATDAALIIDAMDLLYTSSVDGFCLVSSDSDFTRLAMRLREAGKLVIGMGNSQAPQPYRASCDTFFELEKFVAEEEEGDEEEEPEVSIKVKKRRRRSTKVPAEAAAEKKAASVVVVPAAPPESEEERLRREMEESLREIVTRIADQRGWAGLSSIGTELNKLNPDFHVKDYGFKKLVDLIRSYPGFEVERRTIKRVTLYYVRIAS